MPWIKLITGEKRQEQQRSPWGRVNKVKNTFPRDKWKALSHLELRVTELHAGNDGTVR